MQDLPRPGLEPVSPALAGRFSTTAPPGKPRSVLLERRKTNEAPFGFPWLSAAGTGRGTPGRVQCLPGWRKQELEFGEPEGLEVAGKSPETRGEGYAEESSRSLNRGCLESLLCTSP